MMFASAFSIIDFGQYIVVPLPFLDGRALIVLIGLVGLAAITGLNYYGTDESSGAQNLMIGAELVVVLAYVAVGVFFIKPGMQCLSRVDRWPWTVLFAIPRTFAISDTCEAFPRLIKSSIQANISSDLIFRLVLLSVLNENERTIKLHSIALIRQFILGSVVQFAFNHQDASSIPPISSVVGVRPAGPNWTPMSP